MSEIDKHVKAPWGLYDPCDRLVYLGLHASHIAAWAAYFGNVVPYNAITNKVNDGWYAKRVTVEPITNVVGLRRHAQVTPARDTLEVGKLMSVETGD